MACLVLLAGCPRALAVADDAQPPAASSARTEVAAADVPRSLAAFLPDRAGPFSAEPPTHGDGWVRRIYVRGMARVNVTLGEQGGSGPTAFGRWISMSAAYPQIPLRASPADANGFFDCKGQAGVSCDAHIHFRSGLHLELFGGGTATSGELLALLDALPVEVIAASP